MIKKHKTNCEEVEKVIETEGRILQSDATTVCCFDALDLQTLSAPAMATCEVILATFAPDGTETTPESNKQV